MSRNHYLDSIINVSDEYLRKIFNSAQYENFKKEISSIYEITEISDIVKKFCEIYINFIKKIHQDNYSYNHELDHFIANQSRQKIVWGDCYDVLKSMKNESVHCMVTSPPYYNARDYSQWTNITKYLDDMEKIINECFRVLDNHRVFVFNVGDIFDNDNMFTASVWGKRRLPLGAYFIKLFEDIGFTFVDDIIWDKGEVQSERHKNGNRPYPFYQYPMNCYEHILIFYKHRLDTTRYPCPICGTLNVNGNSYTEKGLKSWECKNINCFVRSKSNRGKRFSAKTFNTQNDDKNIHSILEKDFVYSWRRDIKRLNPVIKINSKGENLIGHTAPFPPEIPEFATKMFSYKGEIVLDPFSGIGTSIKVAASYDRLGVGIEKDTSLQKHIYSFMGGEKILEYHYVN